MPCLDLRDTWKPYRVAYEIIRAERGREMGSRVEVITKSDQGLLTDLGTWCAATGHDLVSTDAIDHDLVRSVVRKGESRRIDKTMTVIVSTAALDQVVFPLDKAVAAAVLGMEVNAVFEGAGVRLLKRGYRSRLSGMIGARFTPMVERVMRREIGWPLPAQSIEILEDLGARFYVCGPSMFGYGVREQDLLIGQHTVAAVVTWAELLSRSDIQVFSKMQFEKP
ncbi:MAG TPA: DsrE family protein [Candidatus Binatia bacterium]|nr:DsrE family protein [Candidatus Binatia bacterium]